MPPELLSKKELPVSTGQYTAQPVENQQSDSANTSGNCTKRRPLEAMNDEAMNDEAWTGYFPPKIWRQACLIQDKPLSADQWQRIKRDNKESVEDHPGAKHLQVRMKVKLAKKLNADLNRMYNLSSRN